MNIFDGNNVLSIKDCIEISITNKNRGDLKHFLGKLLRKSPTVSAAKYIIKKAESEGLTTGNERRVFFLRSFTIEPIIPLMVAHAAIDGIKLIIEVGGFNTYTQEIINSESALYSSNPEIVILAIRATDLIPNIFTRFSQLTREESMKESDAAFESIKKLVMIFKENSQASLIIHNLELPDIVSNGIYDNKDINGQIDFINNLNSQIKCYLNEVSGVFMLDYQALVSRIGMVNWSDEEKWATVGMPIRASSHLLLSEEYIRYIYPLFGKSIKVIVVDLDNTLWGGILGEDGFDGIMLGNNYPGFFYKKFQQLLLNIHDRGILLAICSKNNEDEAFNLIDNHPEMILRSNNFVSHRINWADKAQNIIEIANELNLGLDSFMFIDDNLAETSRVRGQLPEVIVFEMPTEPLNFISELSRNPMLERLSISHEDRVRTAQYSEERGRRDLLERVDSLEDYLRSLETRVNINLANPLNVGRVSQLTQKTNQFNLTTRRYSEQQVLEMIARPDCRIYLLNARDRFGDHGIVGLAIVYFNEDICDIDTFLLSCRVIGRGVETALLARISADCYDHGICTINGLYIKTKKNIPAEMFYDLHGFTVIESSELTKKYSIDLLNGLIKNPDWIICGD